MGRRQVVIEGWEAAGAHLRSAYLRYSFTKGTEQEVDFLVDVLDLAPGSRVLDVGCGPGRHAHALARRGIEVVGLDLSPDFVEVARHDAPASASFVVGDARSMTFDAEFDAAVSLCQGGFGLVGEHDLSVLDGIRRALRPGAAAAVTGFSAYFQVRYLEEGDAFDADTGTNVEITAIRDEGGAEVPFRLETTVFTPRELRLLCRAAGLEPEVVWSVTPGRYERLAPTIDRPELLVIARRPAAEISR